MNTGFLGPAVATVLTVYGIETRHTLMSINRLCHKLQQCLPFTVLKLAIEFTKEEEKANGCNSAYRLRY